MATKKNKNIKTYDLESVYSEYTQHFSQIVEDKISELTELIDNLNKSIAANEYDLEIAKVEAKNLNPKNIERVRKHIANMEKSLKDVVALTDEERSNIEKELAKAKKSIEQSQKSFEKFSHVDTSNMSDKEKKAVASKIKSSQTRIDNLIALTTDIEKKLAADNNVKKLNETKAIIDEIDMNEIDLQTRYENELAKIELYTTALKEDKENLKKAEAELKKLQKDPKPDVETFTKFLEDNGLSTVHAEELFKYHSNPEKFEQIAYDDFRMRKMHPKRDYFIKKVVIPAAITSTAIGATIGAIAGSGLVGGSTVMGFIPVSGTPGLTAMATTMTGAVAGLASTPVVIKGKNLITRTYYSLRSKSADKNLDDYTNGTSMDNVNLSKFIAKIQNTQHKILEASGPRKVALNTINRNRIHQVEAVTKQLLTKYYEIDNNKSIAPQLKAKQLKPIYEMLLKIQDFISDDIADAKAHAMLTCKENKKKHTHTYMIENVDIYANLKIYLDRIAQISADQANKQQQLKLAKRTTKNLAQKKEEAYAIINGERIISKMLNFEDKYGQYFEERKPKAEPKKQTPKTTKTQQPKTTKTQQPKKAKTEQPKVEEPKVEEPKPADRFAPTPEVKVIIVETDEHSPAVTLHLENGKAISIPEGVDKSKNIATAKESKNKFSITYADGTKQEILKKVKVSAEVSAARHNLAVSLQVEKTIKDFKDKGFQTTTINTLRDKLKTWCEMENASTHESPKLQLSGKVKELYLTAMDDIIKISQEELDII